MNKFWKLCSLVALLIACGTGAYTMYASKAFTYLSEDSRYCMNCHSMDVHYATWQRNGHSRNATCARCHLPSDSFFRKYWVKAKMGIHDAIAFTANDYSPAIMISEENSRVVQNNCISCHQKMVRNMIENWTKADSGDSPPGGKWCWECHREIAHGLARGRGSAQGSLAVSSN